MNFSFAIRSDEWRGKIREKIPADGLTLLAVYVKGSLLPHCNAADGQFAGFSPEVLGCADTGRKPGCEPSTALLEEKARARKCIDGALKHRHQAFVRDGPDQFLESDAMSPR